MGKSKKPEILSVILGAVQLAVLFWPAIYIIDLISYKYELIAFILPVITMILSFIATFSKNLTEALLKITLSLFLTPLLNKYLMAIDFSERAIDWFFPDYIAAGTRWSLGIIFMMIVCSNAYIMPVSALICHFVKSPPKLLKIIFVLQKILCTAVCAAILIAIFTLDIIMPDVARIGG